MTKNSWQISGAAGILFVVTFVVGIFVQGDVADYKDSGETIVAWYEDNADQFLVGDFITGLAFIFFYFPFLAGLYARLSEAEGEPRVFSRTVLAGGILFPVAGLIGGVFVAGLALLKDDASAEVAVYASAASYHTFTALSGLAAVLMGAASVVILTRSAFWKWLGWLGVVAAVLGIIGGAASLENDPDGVISGLGFLSFILLGVWILAASAGLWRYQQTTATVAAPSA